MNEKMRKEFIECNLATIEEWSVTTIVDTLGEDRCLRNLNQEMQCVYSLADNLLARFLQ